MKKWLMILSSCILIFSGLLIWRNNSNQLNYNIYNKSRIPLVNFHSLIFENEKEKIFYHIDYSLLLNIDSLKRHKFIGLIEKDVFNKGEILALGKNLFSVKKGIIFYCDITNTPPKRYMSINMINHESTLYGSENDFKKDLTLHDLKFSDLKTYNEWSLIWKKEGRLPWFPEHIGKSK